MIRVRKKITKYPASYRCLGPFLVETCALVEAGVGLEKLDKVMKAYGLPVGPITLADEVRVSSPEYANLPDNLSQGTL